MRHILLAIILFSTPVAFAQDEAPAVEASAPADAIPMVDEADAIPEAPDADAPEADAEAPVDAEPAVDMAAAVESSSDEVTLLVEALQSKNWALVLGLLLSLLVAVANKFGLKNMVGAKAIPWVTSAVAVGGALGAALISGSPLTSAVSQGLVAGVAAIGGWEMVLKHILARKSDPLPE